MPYRLLLILLIFSACGGPDVLYEDAAVSVVRQEMPKGFRPGKFQQYRAKNGSYVLNGGARGVAEELARTQGQWLNGMPAEAANQSLVVALKPRTEPSDPAVWLGFLKALGLVGQPTGETNHYVYLRAPGLDEDVLLSTRLRKVGLTQNAALYRLDTAGVHLLNDTGIPLRIDEETLDRYLIMLQGVYGGRPDSVEFRLEVVPYPGVELHDRL